MPLQSATAQQRSELLAGIENYLARHKERPARFGRRVCNDPTFVFKLRKGKQPLSTRRAALVHQALSDPPPPVILPPRPDEDEVADAFIDGLNEIQVARKFGTTVNVIRSVMGAMNRRMRSKSK